MKARFLVGLTAALAAAAATAIVAVAAPQGKSAAPIVIGSATGQSGFMTAYDGPANNFAKLAIRDINAKGGVLGHPLKIIFADTKSDRAQGPVAAKQVIANGAQIMIVSCDYDYGSPAGFVAVQKGMLAMSACCASPKCGIQGVGPTFFSMGTATTAQGAIGAEWAYSKGWRKGYMLLDNTIEYTRTLCGYWKQRWQQLPGTSILGEDTFQQQDTSVAAQIARLKALKTKPDYIYFCSYTPGGPTALRQIRAAGINVPIVSSESLDGNYWLKTVPGLSNFYYSTYGYIYGASPNAEMNRAVANYVKAYGSLPPTSQGMTGYAVIQAFAKAIEKTGGSTNGKKLTAQLEKFRDEPLLVGPTTFTNQIHITLNRPMFMLGVKNDKHYFVEVFRAKKVPQPKF